MRRERVHGRRLNRAREDGAAGRAIKKIIGPSSWFKRNIAQTNVQEDEPSWPAMEKN